MRRRLQADMTPLQLYIFMLASAGLGWASGQLEGKRPLRLMQRAIHRAGVRLGGAVMLLVLPVLLLEASIRSYVRPGLS